MFDSWADAICPVLERGDELVLAMVVNNPEATPCLAGRKMIVHGDESLVGTIGCEVLEAEGQQRAGEVFRSGISQLFTCNLSGSLPPGVSGCGAKVEVLLELVDAARVNLEIFSTLREAMRTGEECLLGADLGDVGSAMRRVNRFLLRKDGALIGEFNHPQWWIATLAETVRNTGSPVLATVEGRRFVVERCRAAAL